MATIGENLRTEILAISGIGDAGVPVAQNLVPAKEQLPWIWFSRTNEESPIFLDGSLQPLRSEFSVEAVSDDIDQSIDLADRIRAGLNGRFGDFGDQKVRGVQVQEKDDSYISRTEIEEGFHVTALTVLIMH